MVRYQKLIQSLRAAGRADQLLTRMRLSFLDAAGAMRLIDEFGDRWEHRATQDLIDENKFLQSQGVTMDLLEERRRKFEIAIKSVRQNQSGLLGIGSSGPI